VTGDEVITKVVDILGPNAEVHRRKIERTIRHGLNYVSRASKVEMASGRYGVVTDKQKNAADKSAVAIHRLQAALRNPDLVRNHLPRYSTDAADGDDAFERFNADLEWLRQCYKADAQTKLRDKRYRAVDWSAHEAARTAVKVLQICGLPLTLGKTSKYVKITALVCSKEGADLRKVCRTIQRELRSE
jgi:hypothetical protein